MTQTLWHRRSERWTWHELALAAWLVAMLGLAGFEIARVTVERLG